MTSQAYTAKMPWRRALKLLQEGNDRFLLGQPHHPHTDPQRRSFAEQEDQAHHAFATILSCCDSRVPVERIFDAGIMDLFVVRVAGNSCSPSALGSVEFGLAHVKTPVLVVMGHTGCGAITAAASLFSGIDPQLEENVSSLLSPLLPSVERAATAQPELTGDALVGAAVEANVWRSIETLFRRSAAARRLVQDGAAGVCGAIYDVGTGRVEWLPSDPVMQLLDEAESAA